ncbi:MAG TPA: phosphatase PAP2 family protein, partial [Chloroflexota bacterium]
MHRCRRRAAGGRGNGFRILKSLDGGVPETAASRHELIILALYFGCAVALADALNVRLGVELLTVLVSVAALAISRRPRQFARDWWFFLAGLVLWNLSGPIAARSPFAPHLQPMLQLDDWIGFGHDPVAAVQHHLARSGHVGVLDVVTAVAYNLHLPEPYIAAYVLWRLRRDVYFQFAASALVLLVLGFVTFILFPAIPPWLSSRWYHSPPGVFNGFGPVLHAHPLPFHGTPIFYFFHLSGDSVAAFPSEHAAFPL